MDSDCLEEFRQDLRILRRRAARGEITPEQYERLKADILADLSPPELAALGPPPAPRPRPSGTSGGGAPRAPVSRGVASRGRGGVAWWLIAVVLAGLAFGVWALVVKSDRGWVFVAPTPTPTPTPPPAGALWTDPGVGMRFRYVPAGSFMMGSPRDEEGRDDDERQRHVTITRAFWVGETEVTQGQWKALMGNNPSRFKNCGDDCPVERVTWYVAVKYANALSKSAGLEQCYRISGNDVTFVGRGCEGYRLPTEAEWEYAGRAGSKSALYSGSLTIRGKNNVPELDLIAWYGGNSGVSYSGGLDCSNWPEKQYSSSRCGTHAVRTKQPNAWGLFDMLGNVWEWCWDWYGEYPSGSVTDPTGPSRGAYRVSRGGSWDSYAGDCRSAIRGRDDPGGRGNRLGFRLVRAAR